MTPAQALLESLNQKYGFIASVLVKRDGRFVARAGDPREPTWNDPYNLFFRDAATIANTFDFLRERSPKTLAQDTRAVTVFQVGQDVVLGIVKDDPRNTIEWFHLTTRLAAELPEILAGIEA